MDKILKLNKPDPDEEIDFELKFLTSLSTKQRFQMMFRKIEELTDLLRKSGNRKPFKIIKRK